MFLKFGMNLEDVNSLYKFYGYFRDSMKFVSLYIDLNKHVLRPREREREREREKILGSSGPYLYVSMSF